MRSSTIRFVNSLRLCPSPHDTFRFSISQISTDSLAFTAAPSVNNYVHKSDASILTAVNPSEFEPISPSARDVIQVTASAIDCIILNLVSFTSDCMQLVFTNSILQESIASLDFVTSS